MHPCCFWSGLAEGNGRVIKLLPALSSLRQEAAGAATTLGLPIAGYQSIDLSSGPIPVFERPRPVMVMAGMARPISTTDPQDVMATVTADVILASKSGSGAQTP